MPESTAKVIPSVSAVEITVPVNVDGSTQYIKMGLNLMSIPKALTDAADVDLEALAGLLDKALTDQIDVTGPGENSKVLTMPVGYAMAHAIRSKLKGKTNVG